MTAIELTTSAAWIADKSAPTNPQPRTHTANIPASRTPVGANLFAMVRPIRRRIRCDEHSVFGGSRTTVFVAAPV